MDKLRVFIVDDHPLIRVAMGRILEADGRFIVVGEADNAEDAIRTLDVLGTDLVVMDIQLPGMDGVAATRELKARHDNLKVVILSAFGDNYLLPSIEAGADGYMMKGLSPDQMAQSLLQAAEGMLNTMVPDSVNIGDSQRIGSRVFEHVLRSLPKGFAVISNDNANRLLVTKIRPRFTVHGGREY